MPKYLITGSYTVQGVQGLRTEGGTARVAAVRKLIESLGGTLESMYFAFGSDDWYITVDLPSNAAMAAGALTVASTGSINPRTIVLLTAEDVTHGKPHPEIYLTAAERLGVEPRDMLVLEDSEMGTTAAAAAGAHIISVPHQHSAHFNFSNAKGVATSLIDPIILALIEGTPAGHAG